MNARWVPLAKVLAVVVVLAVIAVTGFLVFRDDAVDDGSSWDHEVVAHVGEVTIAEEQVDAVIDELRVARQAGMEEMIDESGHEFEGDEREQLLQEQAGGLEARLEVDRGRVIEMRILTEAGTGYADETGLTAPEPDRDSLAEQIGLAPDHVYVGVVAEFYAVMNMLNDATDPVEPTEADQREVYDKLVAEGMTQVPFEDAQEVLTMETIGEPVALRDLLVEVIDQADVRVNPEYDLTYQLPVPLGESGSWLDIPIGG